ncbi:MAG: T9SS type A sorting domain-containing protein [Bacteroidia bacterium]|nr:T9SS type A sorting domain-containing protein [Bacteroidia bacterium]
MKHRRYSWLAGILLASLSAWGQPEFTRPTLVPLGTSAEVNELYLTYTVGEPMVQTLVSLNGTLVLTQGFEQPDGAGGVGIDPEPLIHLKYSIFPNPTAGRLFVEMEADRLVDLELQLTDLSGRAVQEPAALRGTGSLRKTLDLSTLPEGYYMLGIRRAGGREIKSFMIQKLN